MNKPRAAGRDVVIAVHRLPHATGLPLPAYQIDGASGLDLAAAVPKESPLAEAEFGTLRLKLVKIAARIVEHGSRIRVFRSTCCPEAAVFAGIAEMLTVEMMPSMPQPAGREAPASRPDMGPPTPSALHDEPSQARAERPADLPCLRSGGSSPSL